MRVFKFMAKWFATVLLALVALGVFGNVIGYALFRTVFSGLGYDTALPVAILSGFAITLALEIACLVWWTKRKGGKR